MGSIMDTEESRAGEHEVAQDKLADGEKGGDEDKVQIPRFLVPGQTTVR